MSWEDEYARKLQTADEALGYVKSGMRVYIQPGCAEPETLVEAPMRRAPEIHDVEIVHMMTMGARRHTLRQRWQDTFAIMRFSSAPT
jgi:4-hydroxybutyrate CoA-transferase